MGNTQASRHRVAFFCRGRILPEELSSLERSGIVFLVTRHIQLGQRVRVRLTLLSKTPSIFAMAPTGLGITTAVLALLSQAQGAILLASHYTGEIHTLSLELGADGAGASLTTTGSATGCGQLPAWLEWDADTQSVYCIDESWFGSGMAASFSVAADGTLTQTGQTTTLGASVHSTLFGGADGKGFLATTE